jgi:predicted RNase H-like HicB family nuclease
MEREFDVLIEQDSEGTYVASVPALHGCHTQAQSLDDARWQRLSRPNCHP